MMPRMLKHGNPWGPVPDRPGSSWPRPVGLARWVSPGTSGELGERLLEILEIPEIPEPPAWKIRTSGVPKRCSQLDFPLFFEVFHSFGA